MEMNWRDSYDVKVSEDHITLAAWTDTLSYLTNPTTSRVTSYSQNQAKNTQGKINAFAQSGGEFGVRSAASLRSQDLTIATSTPRIAFPKPESRSQVCRCIIATIEHHLEFEVTYRPLHVLQQLRGG
ncbi:hypothetical protein HYALB_00008207 [Hymenoscyphus albidus]|uniref:Uncharacterized protein n=1 Tax=Hymenoscyphus albidus TaxID=595503 RepID=A0A9N9LUK6_9HELO|nr:hypothetical protein HYALB_00008207 [Hymenoscyphus albidus]